MIASRDIVRTFEGHLTKKAKSIFKKKAIEEAYEYLQAVDGKNPIRSLANTFNEYVEKGKLTKCSSLLMQETTDQKRFFYIWYE